MKFQIKTYEAFSSKIRKSGVELTAVLISDLHLEEFGKQNDRLLKAAADCRPDVILIAGDMVTARRDEPTKAAEHAAISLTDIAPVFYANGNHEKRMKVRPNIYGTVYESYVKKLRAGGVHYLENETELIRIKDIPCRIYGLDLSLPYFARFQKIHLEKEEIIAKIGSSAADTYNILIAHHPRYGDAYFDWGADLTVSGHVHGGVMRLGQRACVSPDGRIFPKYGYGWFQKKEQYMAVSAGLGEHSIPFRVLNPRELVRIVIKQEAPYGDTR